MQTIRDAVQRTGVPAHTLRAWERRYAVLAPTRTPGGYRVYDDDTIARVQEMARLVGQGVAPAQAADEVRRRVGAPASRVVFADDEDLVQAAATLDAAAVGRILDERFSSPAGLDAVLDGWLMPALARVGRAWGNGQVSVAGEHLVAHAVNRRLSAAYESAGRGGGAAVVIGAPPGVHHELGLLAFGVLARRAGVTTVYLGADVPLDAWSPAIAAASATAAVTVAPRRGDAARARAVQDRLAADHPAVPLWLGGRYQHLVAPPSRQLGHQLGEAARTLAASLPVGRPA